MNVMQDLEMIKKPEDWMPEIIDAAKIELDRRGEKYAATNELESTEQDVDLELGFETKPIVVTTLGSPGTIPWFHRLHLPARAMWADQLCQMPDEAGPQQHEPSSSTEVDNWLVSAIRYMRHEFSQYSA